MASSRRSARGARGTTPVLRAARSAWPILAGALAAVGVIGSTRQYGVVGLALIYAGSAAFGMIMMCAGHADRGLRGVPVVRVGLGAAAVLVVMLGTISLFPILGWFAVAVVALTSPPATAWLARRRGRDQQRARAFVAEALSSDQTLVDRSFDRIVAGLQMDESWGNDGA